MSDWKPAKRKRITVPELRVIVQRQAEARNSIWAKLAKDMTGRQLNGWFIAFGGYCECGCERPLMFSDPPEYEHTIPVSIQHEGDKVEWRVFRKSCHAIKTTQDRKDIARAKRLARKHGIDRDENPWREPKGNAKMQSRPMSKHPTLKRGVDGKVRPR